MLASAQADPWEDGPTPAPAALLTRASLSAAGALGKRARKVWNAARASASGSPLWRATLARPAGRGG